MNIILRLKNKATLVALVAAIVAFAYQGCGIFGIVPSISSEMIVEWLGVLINILVILGIVVDPTTKGIGDSAQAMAYTAPKED